jgi:PAS domain-containing protein
MRHQKDLSLILARDLASHLATPFFVVDPEGTLIFYNEPAERVLGREFGEAGELAQEEWGTIFHPLDLDGREIPVEQLPLSIALRERVAAHRSLLITGLDGIERTIGVTAFPLLPHPDELVGAIAIFWEETG